MPRRVLPLADGGDGTAAVLGRALGGQPERLCARDAMGRERTALAFTLAGRGAALDLAAVCGVRRMLVRGEPLSPLDASTQGLGAALLTVVARVPDGAIYVGLGGSASTDGGAGLLGALGGRLLDRLGRPIPAGARGLERVERIDLAAIPRALSGRVVALVDVAAVLLGEAGSARLFGPQKGADASTVARLEAALDHFRQVCERDLGAPPSLAERPGTGSAGGTGYALALLGAPLTPGADAVLDLVGFDTAAARAALVIVGEGVLDRTSLVGKAPTRAALRARALGRQVALVCARATADALAALESAGVTVLEAAPNGGRAGVAELRGAAKRATGQEA
jgi:glycerate 2-kinase